MTHIHRWRRMHAGLLTVRLCLDCGSIERVPTVDDSPAEVGPRNAEAEHDQAIDDAWTREMADGGPQA